jgi:hypothetical protein
VGPGHRRGLVLHPAQRSLLPAELIGADRHAGGAARSQLQRQSRPAG